MEFRKTTTQRMFNQVWLSVLLRQRSLAVIRASEFELGRKMAIAVASGGMRLIEITWNSDRSEKLIAQLRSELPDCMIGAGTLLNLNQMEQAIANGAQFLFTPHVDSAMIQAAVTKNIPIIPGALTPTEIVNAYSQGATCVKVFPIQAMGGASYIKSLQAPLGQIPLIPTGGVTLENASEFILAGAVAVGLSSELFPKKLVTNEDWEAIALNAKTLLSHLSTLKN